MTLFMGLAVCACGTAEPKGENESALFSVGYGREKIMPQASVALAGNGTYDRNSEGFLDYLYITCIAITDKTGETVLIYTQDLLKCSENTTPEAQKKVSEATGIPVENILISSTHTHSAPAINSLNSPNISAYRELYFQAAVDAAKNALADRSVAEISTGTALAEGLAFSRNYLLEDGSVSSKSGIAGRKIVGHADEADQEVQIIRFSRQNHNKQDIILMNFTVHPTINSGKNITADVPGPTRDYIESQTGALVAYFNAASGNQIYNDETGANNHGLEFREYGQKLGQTVVDALPELTAVESGNVNLKTAVFSGGANKLKVDMVQQAKEVVSAYGSGGTTAAAPLLSQYGFSSVWEAEAVIDRSTAGETIDMTLWAMSIGEIAFVFAPYEMFAPTGMYIKENSPFDMTFIITCANDAFGYLPTEKAYAYEAYETYVARFVSGTAEKVADNYLEMLDELKKSC